MLATKLFAGKTKFPSIEIGVQTDENLTDRYVDKRVSYNGSKDPRTPQNDPFVLFKTLFGTPGADNSGAAMRAFLDKSVLDNSLADFARLNPKLSKSDQILLQQHADSIRKLETQLGTVVDCGSVTAPTVAGLDTTTAATTHKWAMDSKNYQAVGAMMMDIAVEAMACGLTNVITFMWRNSESDQQLPFLTDIDYTLNGTPGHHGMSHARHPGLVAIDQWYATQFNGFINKLSAVPDSGAAGTLMDNSLLMWSSCLGDASAHTSTNVPVILAGSNGGYFKTGRNIQFNDKYTADQWAGDPLGAKDGDALTAAADKVRSGDQKSAGLINLSNNDLAVSILNSFGMPDTTFGDSRFCHGALPHLTTTT